jgi:PD-(D/E)XK endonuclease
MNTPLPTTSRGGICQALATAYFLSQGYIVSQPLYDNAPYDLIVDDGSRLLLVPCRYSTLLKHLGGQSRQRHDRRYEYVDLRSYGGAGQNKPPSGYRVYRAADFDLPWVMTSTVYYLIPATAIYTPGRRAHARD